MIRKLLLFVLTFVVASLLLNRFIFIQIDEPARLILAYGLSLILSGFLMTQMK